MMKYLFTLLLAFLFVGCSTLEVEHDYDENYNFTKVHTFRIMHNVKEGENTLLNERITTALRDVLEKKGYQKVEHNADLIFVYHYGVKDKVDLQTDYQMIGFPRRGFGGGAMIATTTTYEYKEGTIIIDAYDTQTKKIVWRAVGVLEVQHQETPQERRAYVYKIISGVMKDFPPHKQLQR